MKIRTQHVPLVPSAIVAALSVIAAFGFRGVFPDWTFLPAAVIGAVGAIAVSIGTRTVRLPVAESLIASLLVFVMLGAVAAEGIPTPDAYGTFFSGLINGWARVLSSIPPAALVAEYRVLPYTVGWLGAMIGGEILRSERTSGLAVLGPVGGLVLTTLVSLENRTVALVQGALLVVGALTLGFVQQQRRFAASKLVDGDGLDDSDNSWRGSPLANTGSAIMMAVLIAVGASVIGPRLPAADAHDRFDLREFQTPPFDPLDEPTPLTQIKAGLQEANADRVVFTVTSAEPISRITLAVLDNYNDEYWLVADEREEAPAEFRPVDSVFPLPVDGTIDDWNRVAAEIEIVDLDQLAGGEFDPVWLPMPGWPLSIESTDDLDVRFNQETGTIALAPDGPVQGMVYDVVAARPPNVEELNLDGATVTLRDPYDLAVPQLRSFAGDVLEGADVGWQQIEAIRSRLADTGAYDSRAASPTGRPGHHLGRLAEFVDDPDRIVGFEEQYAATAALLARSEGLPTRVVVGFSIPPEELAARTEGQTLSVLANDIGAWIEVRFDGIGWIPFDVTPPRDRVPEDAPIGRSEREVAVPNPPPEPPPPVLPPDLDLEAPIEEEVEDPSEPTEESSSFPVRRVLIGTAIASPFLLIVGALLLIVGLKRRRTRRRREAATPARRVAGAWYELMDRVAEQGGLPPKAATNREIANGLREVELLDDAEAAVLISLASDVDRAAFHPDPPDGGAAENAWRRSDELCHAVRTRNSVTRRAVQRLDPRPLFDRDPLSEPEMSDDDDR